jgi:hypothetical protein
MHSQTAPHWADRLRRLGWLTVVFFTVKGLATSALLAWAFFRALA